MAVESVKFDRAVDYYDQTRGFPPGVEKEIAALVARTGQFTPAARVLEIGVGTGRIALPMSEHVGAIYGVDLSRPMMDRLRAKRTQEAIHLALADASRLPFAAGSFDGAVAVHVFHLIPTWREVLGEVARVLRPGAALVNAGNTDTLDSISGELKRRGEVPHVENVGVSEEDHDTFLVKSGWKPLGEQELIGWSTPFRPADAVAHITNRTSSATWRMTDAQIEQYAEALRRAFIERFGALDSEHIVSRAFAARAFLPPGQSAMA
jgi:ubiquinone/menaquinone biosynthesis C-methylase UbiE